MEKREEEQIRALMNDVPELRALYEEHIDLEKRLQALNHRHHLTNEEEQEKKRLQKIKLAGKDRMMTLLLQLQGQQRMAAPRKST